MMLLKQNTMIMHALKDLYRGLGYRYIKRSNTLIEILFGLGKLKKNENDVM